MNSQVPAVEAPIFTIQGLRAHAFQELFANGLSFAAMGLWISTAERQHALIYGASTLVLGALILIKLIRSRIRVFEDRIEFRAWDSLLGKSHTVPMAELRKVARHGSVIRLGWDDDRQPRHLKVSMQAVVAENFFDQLLRVVEEHPGLGRVQEKSETRFLVAPPPG